jgi:secreted PhoX family phosphatase
MAIMDRRTFMRRSAAAGGGPAALGPLGARTAYGAPRSASAGYGPLVPKGDLALPAEFSYQIIDRQGIPMRDGRPTPGIFDAMGAFPDVGGGVGGRGDRTILIRNHENRERPGEIKVVRYL